MKKHRTIEDYIKEIQHALIQASLNYDIWRVYTSPKYRKRFNDTMNNYDAFFHASIHAHFLATIVPLYRIYETRQDSYNFKRLLIKMKEINLNTTKIEMKLLKTKLAWAKIAKIRNEVFGHRIINSSIEEIFNEASIRPIDIYNLIILSKSIVNNISYMFNNSSNAFNLSAKEDTLNLLKDLKKINFRK